MTTPTFPVIDVAMDFLREGDGEERYVWVARADEALNALLDVIFTLDQEPMPLVDQLLRLACALERELGSPTAASYLIAIAGADRRVQALLKGRPDEELRALGLTMRAPMYGVEAPEGSISAASLMEDRKNRVEPIKRAPKPIERTSSPRRKIRIAAP